MKYRVYLTAENGWGEDELVSEPQASASVAYAYRIVAPRLLHEYRGDRPVTVRVVREAPRSYGVFASFSELASRLAYLGSHVDGDGGWHRLLVKQALDKADLTAGEFIQELRLRTSDRFTFTSALTSLL